MLGRIGAALALMAMAIGMGLCGMDPARAQQACGLQNEPATVRHIPVTRYKSRTVRLECAFTKAVVGAPDIADVLPMSNHVIYIQGKKVGTTNVSVFDQDKDGHETLISVIDLEVTLDNQNIQKQICAGKTRCGIHVSSSNNQIVLTGQARNSEEADRVYAIARSMVTTDDGKALDRQICHQRDERRRVAAGDAESPFHRSEPPSGAGPWCELVRRQCQQNTWHQHRKRCCGFAQRQPSHPGWSKSIVRWSSSVPDARNICGNHASPTLRRWPF
jgi:hypothetical protein